MPIFNIYAVLGTRPKPLYVHEQHLIARGKGLTQYRQSGFCTKEKTWMLAFI